MAHHVPALNVGGPPACRFITEQLNLAHRAHRAHRCSPDTAGVLAVLGDVYEGDTIEVTTLDGKTRI